MQKKKKDCLLEEKEKEDRANQEKREVEAKLRHLEWCNDELKSNVKRLESECSTLLKDNLSLKNSVKRLQGENRDLREETQVLKMEIELMNFNPPEKHEACSVEAHVEMKDDESDVKSDIVNQFCDELCSVPRLLSPFPDNERFEGKGFTLRG